MTRLLTIAEAAERLNVSRRGLRAEAERHGFIVRVGKAIRIAETDLGELIKKCRDPAKGRDSSTAPTVTSSSFATANTECQQALESAAKLKERSRRTSRPRTGPPAQVMPIR